MKITVLGSGSKGNSTLVETTSCNILIDAGLNIKNIEKRINKELPKINILIITHTHTDHTNGIKSIIKKYNPKIYTTSKELEKITNYPNINYEKEINIDKTDIKLFDLSHDVICCGILIKDNDEELVYITDTGYLNKKILEEIKEKDVYIIESNHDEEMLRNGKYPFHLQQRIRSDKGHLSNESCAKYLKKIIGKNTKYIVLAHLSEENNTQEKAYNNTKNILEKKDIKLLVADQNKPLETIEV